MAIFNEQENDLVAIRLSMSREGRTSRDVIVQVVRRGTEEIGDSINVSADAIGIPRTLDQAREYKYGDPTFSAPPFLLDELRTRIANVLPPRQQLWLELAAPMGNLPLVPWERLLQPVVNLPILRVPYFTLPPVRVQGPLDIAFCTSEPIAKEPVSPSVVLNVVGRIQAAAPPGSTIHLFTDTQLAGPLQAALGAQPGVQFYLPSTAEEYSAPTRDNRSFDEGDGLQNPWLLWMRDALQVRGVDAVHFFCHGYLSVDQGALSLAESPVINDDFRTARFVGARQLARFLAAVGATSVSFSSWPDNYAVLGLRLLVHQLALVSTNSVLLHDSALDPAYAALQDALHTLYDPSDQAVLPSPAVTLYCHPTLVGQQSDDTAGTSLRYTRELTLASDEFAPRLERKSGVQPWVVSAQRVLEQKAAQLLQDQKQFPQGSAAHTGAEEALRAASDILRRHGQL